VGERGQLVGHAVLRQDAGDVGLPAARPDDAVAELVGLAELEADASAGLLEGAVADAVGEEREHALLVGAEAGASAAGQAGQDRVVLVLGGLHLLRAGAAAGAAREPDALVDDAHLARVVDQATVGPHLGVHAHPEADLVLQLRRARERVRLGPRTRRGEPRPEQQPEQERDAQRRGGGGDGRGAAVEAEG